jgi:hypothetical protein
MELSISKALISIKTPIRLRKMDPLVLALPGRAVIYSALYNLIQSYRFCLVKLRNLSLKINY